MTLLERLLTRLRLKPADTDQFIGGAGEGGVTQNNRLFGGLVAAQAAVAAASTVEAFPIHSLHAYFLRPGRPEQDILFEVERSKQGRNFHVRSVRAWQGTDLIFQLQASFERAVPGVRHQTQMPAVLHSPTQLPNRDALRGRTNWRDMPIDVRMVTPLTSDEALPAMQQIWIRPSAPLPDNESLHLGLLVYASDRALLDTAWRPHAATGALRGASLDHSMWFHRAPRFDDWLLYDMHSPAAGMGRGLALGALYTADGERVVTVAQEGVLRVASPARPKEQPR